MLVCSKLRAEHLAEDAAIGNVKYEDTFSNTNKQKKLWFCLQGLLKQEQRSCSLKRTHPGIYWTQAWVTTCAVVIHFLLKCIVLSILGYKYIYIC